jgi:ABC-type phosphate/phosphonate transport system permease subunit
MNQKIIDGLRKVGAKQLQESYPSVTPENITTDSIYKEFFATSLEETLEEAPPI